MWKIPLQHLALATVLLAGSSTTSAQSQSPAADAEASPNTVTTHSLPCVLLKNDNVLFGRAFQVGEYVVVQTGSGGEVQLPREKVVCWAGSLRDLYRYRVDHRRKGDIAAHLRDARWCLRHDLFDLAAQEIRAINVIDPGNADAESIEDQLQRVTSPDQGVYSGLSVEPAQVQPVVFDDAGPELGGVDLVTLRGFASHVQPMLLNRCGRCHAHDSSREWTLLLPSSGARASSRMTRENLAASLGYINRTAPDESDLLVKATTPHGGGPAPLDPRSAKAIQSFKIWLAMASTALPKSQSDRDVVDHNAFDPQDPTPAPSIASLPDEIGDETASSNRRGQPARLPQVANPFDPDLFNRRFHADSSAE